MKSTLSGMKCILRGVNRVHKEKDQNIDREDGKAKDTQLEWKEKRSQVYNNLWIL